MVTYTSSYIQKAHKVVALRICALLLNDLPPMVQPWWQHTPRFTAGLCITASPRHRSLHVCVLGEQNASMQVLYQRLIPLFLKSFFPSCFPFVSISFSPSPSPLPLSVSHTLSFDKLFRCKWRKYAVAFMCSSIWFTRPPGQCVGISSSFIHS